MRLEIRAARFVGVVGGIVAIPLVLLLALMDEPRVSSTRGIVLMLSPVLIGLAATAWWLVLRRLLRIATLRGAVVGAATGVLTFMSYAAMVEIWLMATSEGRIGMGFLTVGLYGFLLFGWIPVLAGAFSGWIAERHLQLKLDQ